MRPLFFKSLVTVRKLSIRPARDLKPRPVRCFMARLPGSLDGGKFAEIEVTS